MFWLGGWDIILILRYASVAILCSSAKPWILFSHPPTSRTLWVQLHGLTHTNVFESGLSFEHPGVPFCWHAMVDTTCLV